MKESRHNVAACAGSAPPIVDELIELVAERAGISSDEAALAVAAMLGYLMARLPSPVVGRIREELSPSGKPDVDQPGVE